MRIMFFSAMAGAAVWLMYPAIVLAQAAGTTGGAPAEAARKFRTYLEEDWKRWIAE